MTAAATTYADAALVLATGVGIAAIIWAVGTWERR